MKRRLTGVADYLIVGGGVAGGHAVFEIRNNDKSGRVVVINEEKHFSYDRPPLSKEYLAGKEKKDEVFFKDDAYYAKNKVEVLRGERVLELDAASRKVTTDGGRELSYKVLLLATGGRVRKLDVPGSDLEGVHYLRTIEDCDAIKTEASRGKRAVVVGGGFIGCEVAATLRSRGLKVTLVHKSSQLLSSAIDEETARWIEDYHRKRGVTVVTNASVASFGGKRRVASVVLEGGMGLPADVVVVGVGILPNVELAAKAGLKVDNGILVDEYLRTSAEDVYAAGDVARFYSPLFKRHLRVEHVDVAQNQGTTAGMNMSGQNRPFDAVPYFFSNQYDLELNAYGDLSRRSLTVRRGKMDAKTGFITFYLEGSLISGILAVNADWKEIGHAKTLLEMRKDIADPSVLADESKTLRSTVKSLGGAGK